MQNPVESQDDDEGQIWEPVKLTPYDRRRQELRELEAKRDAILAKQDRTDDDQRRLAALAPLITKAQARFDREAKRGMDALWRKRRGIDEWRESEAGRETYNSSRRKVRVSPNAAPRKMTPETKAQHDKDMASDRVWRSRCRKAGWPEDRIQAELVVRIRDRDAKRNAQAQDDAEEAAMRALPGFGAF
jgi:hypothetical protein